MHSSPPSRRRRAGYTLVEVLAASGLIAAAIGAASSLSMTMTSQEEIARGHAAAIRYAEAVARLWQIGVNPSTVLLNQPEAVKDSNTATAMSYVITPGAATDIGLDAGVSEGTVETATVTVNWRPYGSTSPSTVTFDAIRPPAAHR